MIIVSIGLIRARAENAHIIAEQLTGGTLVPDRIVFCVSREPFFLDKGFKKPPQIKHPCVEFRYVPNIGPLRRIIPILKEYWTKPSTRIVLIDDDKEVAKDAIENLIHYSDKYPNRAIGYRGYNLNRFRTKGVVYKHRTIYRSWQIKKPLKVDVLNGGWFNLVKPGFFHPDILEWEKYRKYGVEYSDEVFLAYNLARKGIHRFVIPHPHELHELPTCGASLADDNTNRLAKEKQARAWYEVVSSGRVRVYPSVRYLKARLSIKPTT